MSERLIIAIDGGGTGTRIGLYDEAGVLLGERTGAQSNPFQMSLSVATDCVTALAQSLLADRNAAELTILAGISGAREEAIREEFARALCSGLNAEQAVVTTDVHAQLLGNAGMRSAIAVVAGTGSSVAVLDAEGKAILLGGRGAVLGDDGSAYHLVVTALRSAFRWQDEFDQCPKLLARFYQNSQLDNDAQIVSWSTTAEKQEIAAFASTVLEHAESGDAIACGAAEACSAALAEIVQIGIHRTQLGLKARIYLLGGLFEKSTYYRELFTKSLRSRGVTNDCSLAPLTGHAAVFNMYKLLPLSVHLPHASASKLSMVMSDGPSDTAAEQKQSPIDSLDSSAIVERFALADRAAVAASSSCRAEIAQLIDRVAAASRADGRLIYIGAGTSGRLGVLDASECPPTFGTLPGQVIGIIAGGEPALRNSIEGAEDDEEAGRRDIGSVEPPIGNNDVVVGIAASGTTPYTLAAIAEAKRRGATTALVHCNPGAKAQADHVLTLHTGAEVLPGSTRLKAGTATKIVLNAITTGAMALSGRVFEGYMIHVQPTNVKLRKRAAKIVAVLTGLSDAASADLLAQAENDPAAALLMHKLSITVTAAKELLVRTRGDVRAAIALHEREGAN